MGSEKAPAGTRLESFPPRRRVVEYLLGGSLLASLASFIYPVLRYLVPPPTADLGSDTAVAGRSDELKQNSGKIFPFGGRPALLIRTAEGEYRAMSATCTHLNCTVQFRSDVRQVWCACHNGFYDVNGRNIAGPPPRPLETYEVHVRGQEVIVNRRREA